ncbi:hypothetical protein SOVF_035160 [Spinacia oleracea]|nr:hypothetical protein SOVF_035160 [Spinacia oleracea]
MKLFQKNICKILIFEQRNVKDSHEDSFIREKRIIGQSAPLFTLQKFKTADLEKIRQLQTSSSRKFHSYDLPKPGDTSRISARSENRVLSTKPNHVLAENLYHSPSLVPNTYEKLVRTEMHNSHA